MDGGGCFANILRGYVGRAIPRHYPGAKENQRAGRKSGPFGRIAGGKIERLGELAAFGHAISFWRWNGIKKLPKVIR